MGKSIQEIIEELHGKDLQEYKDEMQELVIESEDIIEISADDKKFMENFTNLVNLSLVQCKLKSLKNFPKLDKIERVSNLAFNKIQIELMDNNITGGLKELAQYSNLRVLKMGGNKIKKLSDIEELKTLKHIENLDFAENPVTEDGKYKDKVWEMFSSLNVLDGLDKDGEECLSVVEDEGDFEGEGEGDEAEGEGDDGEGDDGEGEGDYQEQEDAEGEEYEPEAEDEEDEDEPPHKGSAKKRQRDDDDDDYEPTGKANKRQKHEEEDDDDDDEDY